MSPLIKLRMIMPIDKNFQEMNGGKLILDYLCIAIVYRFRTFVIEYVCDYIGLFKYYIISHQEILLKLCLVIST